ncbi:translin [Centruroides vittatus]|uniref:translin n=1 Tax=Centruroides vittatus TaxID=120091 RepID=UPI00350F1FDD
MDQSLSDIFASFQKYIDAEQDLREEIRLVIRDLEQIGREILNILQGIHQQDGIEKIPVICEKGTVQYATVRSKFLQLSAKIPKDQYYRYHDHWRFITQRLVFLAALIKYLQTETLLERKEAAEILGVHVNCEDGFHLDLDDYLMGLLSLADELSRFAVNSVTAGNYVYPVKISRFVTELNKGFRLLNLKNDSLRKRFDALKYDLKKVEEIVYDLSIRGMKPENSNTSILPQE